MPDPAPRLLEPLVQMGPALTMSLLTSPPRSLPVTPAPPEPLRTTPNDQPVVGHTRRRMSLKRGPAAPPRPMSHYLPSLPPGAAAPYLGGVLDQFNKESEGEDEADAVSSAPRSSPNSRRASLRRGSMHLRSISTSALESFGNRAQQRRSSSARMTTTPPAVPPRSHLRALVAAGGCVPSSASDMSQDFTQDFTPPRPRPSATRQLSTAASSSASSASSLQYVLDVQLPTSTVVRPPRQPEPADDAAEVISFRSHYQRRKSSGSTLGGVMNPLSSSGDPFRVRDAKPSRSSSSGVYTPKTFPGPQGNPSRAFPGSPTSPPMASGRMSTASLPTARLPTGARVRSVSGLNRFSMANHTHANAPPLPTRHSHYSGMVSHTPNSSLSSAPTPSFSSNGTPAESHSPSTDSVHSAGSASPPATPTTPISAKAYFAQNGVVVIGRDGEDAQTLGSIDDTLGLGFDTTPKVQHRDLATTPTPTLASIPISDRSTPVQLSPDAPKRARRKPVPRLEEDDLVKRLDAIGV